MLQTKYIDSRQQSAPSAKEVVIESEKSTIQLNLALEKEDTVAKTDFEILHHASINKLKQIRH